MVTGDWTLGSGVCCCNDDECICGIWHIVDGDGVKRVGLNNLDLAIEIIDEVNSAGIAEGKDQL